MRSRLIFVGLNFLLFFVGCQNNDDQIRTYRVSKETGPVMPMAAAPSMGSNAAPMAPDMQPMGAAPGMTAAASPKEIEWKAPAGWQEQPPSSMRVGSFLAKGSNGQNVDISVVPLGGQAGGDLGNVNRWRGQINLEPIAEADLPKVSETITAAGRSMLLVDMVSRELLVDNRFPKRLIAAMVQQGDRTWFFKMTGEDKAVLETKPAFLHFLKSLHFHATE